MSYQCKEIEKEKVVDVSYGVNIKVLASKMHHEVYVNDVKWPYNFLIQDFGIVKDSFAGESYYRYNNENTCTLRISDGILIKCRMMSINLVNLD